MGTGASGLLLSVAASLAVVHTAIGVDHAVPFVVLSRVQGWTLKRTLVVTALCGVGHVLSAVVLGLGAVALGIAVEHLAPFDSMRGNVALMLLVAFGLGYAVLGAVHWVRGRPHRHFHEHDDGTSHEHDHGHADEHVHLHEEKKKVITAWTLFVVLVFGPCEALVPLLLAPGVMQDYSLLAAVILVFGGLTVATMLVLVTLGTLGARLVDLEKFFGKRAAAMSEVLAGLTIAATGAAVKVFGL
jgi:ABC-type nickel/cobalt efflux system permease component RcnA